VFDVVIRDGHVVDGTGRQRYKADIGIEEARIVRIGRVSGPAHREIDAGGRIVAPGFIDIHTHYDIQAFFDPTLSPSPLHGVTTVVGGNCGFSVAPISSNSADYIMRTLARVEGMPLAVLEAGASWDWETTADYLERLDGTLAVNAGFMVGHTAIRRLVMGEDSTRRAATSQEVATMSELLRDGLRAGGFGFSTSRGGAHQDVNGDPVPSRLANPEELISLASVCRDFPGTSVEFIPHHRPFTEEDEHLAIDMAVAAGRPLNWNLIISNAASLQEDLDSLELSDRAATLGAKVVALVTPIDVSTRFSFATGFLLDALPGWAKEMSKSHEDKLAMLSDPAERERLNALATQPGPRRSIADWEDKVISEAADPNLKHYEGRLVGEIAQEEGKDPFSALLDIVCADNLRTTFTRLPNDSAADWAARRRIWRDPRTVIGGSDAGAHVDFLAMFHLTTSFLSEGVREHGVFTLEEAISQITSVPADLYGLRDRGRLKPGGFADVVIFDADTIASEPIETRRDLPGGSGRFYSDAIGIDEVLVNGESIVVGGTFTGRRPGTLLRSGRDTVDQTS
jgi:N-acyl-D-aspartate/D-glutamate deacylase